MANDFDQFPTYDPLIKNDSNRMSDIWADFMSTFYMNLIGYLSQNGIFLPQLTTNQRDALKDPQEGQMIYTINTIESPTRSASIQVWQVKANVGAWRTITTVP